MISESDIKEIREAVLNSAHPLIFFDDDPDGLCSFLQFYKLNPEAKGVLYKAAGPLDVQFLKKVEEYQPDLILILDVGNVSQEFLDKASNVYWIDHHAVQDRKRVHYYNPMIESKGKDNRPISYWSHLICRTSVWLSMIGCVADWFLPEDFREEFSKACPNLLADDIVTPDAALFKSEIGKVARILSFLMKGDTREAMACVKTMTRIADPLEILNQSTPQGKYIWKKHVKIAEAYEEIKKTILIDDTSLILFICPENRMSITADLSNEILYEHPDKFIIIGRERNGEYKLSLRSVKYEVLPILEKALIGTRGFGGGHVHACGANIKKDDFEKFLDSIRQQL